MKKAKYTFYFDESYHDRKICVTDDAMLNIWRQDRFRDKYVGCFVGWANAYIPSIEHQYATFEEDARKIFGIEDNYEVKSKLVPYKYFRKGLASFNKQGLQFYLAYFYFLHDTEATWQANIVSKLDLFVRKGLHLGNFHLAIPDEAILYSFTKFFEMYADDNLLKAVADVCNGRMQGYQFRKAVIKRLDEVIQYDDGCRRKRHETLAYKKLKEIIKRYNFVGQESEVSFDYSVDGLGLKLCIADVSRMHPDVHVVVDNEQVTYEAIASEFNTVEQVASEDCFGVRVADLLAGFIARMIHAIAETTLPSSPDLVGEQASETVMWVPEAWFDFYRKPIVFELYKAVASVMIGDNLPYYTVMASHYGDEVSVFFSLLRYMNKFDSFEDYCKVSLDKHYSDFNALSLGELNNILDKM